MRNTIVFLIWIIFIIIISPCSGSDSPIPLTPGEKTWLKENHMVRVRVGNAPPFMMTEGKIQGIAIDYLTHIFEMNGIQFKYISDADVSWPKALEYIKQHEVVDMVPTAKITNERKKNMIFTEEYIFSPWVIFTRSDADFVSSMADLNGKTVSVEEGYVMHLALKQDYPSIKLKVVSAQRKNFAQIPVEDLATGLVDAYIGNLLSTTYVIQTRGYTNIKVAAPTPFGNHNQAMAIRSDWPELAGIVNKTLASMTPQERAAIRNKWLSMRYEYGINRGFVLRWVLGVTGIALFIIGFVLIWNKRLKREVLLREKIETALTESEKKFKALFNNAQVALFRTRTSDGKLLEINERYANMAGYPTIEGCMAEFNAAEAWVDAGGRDKLVKMLEETGSILDYETKIFQRDKTAIWIIFSATIFPEQGYIEGSIVDITQRKQAEQALKERTDFLDKIIDNAALSTWISDEKGTIIRANPACLEFFGATEEEVVGRYNLFKDVVIEKNGLMPDIREVFKRGRAANLVIDYDFGAVGHVNVKNATHKTINSIFTPIKDAHGKVSNVIVQTIDLTHIKQMENDLIQSRRMESIGTLAGGIAHEFNNVLSIIIGNNELVMQELPRGIARESCEDIQIAGMRARDVVKQLLTFSRQDTAVKKVMDIRSVVEESMKLIRSSTPANIEIQQRLADDVPPILGNDTQINQLLINLCNNAVDAIPKVGGILAVDLCNETVEKSHANSHPKLKPGQYVKLSIRDNGDGMEKAILDKVFEPYFTTKEIGKGTGIGLAVVHGIVEKHEGSIIAESHPGQGTVFTILLPVHEGVLEKVADDQNFLPTGKEHILYVDDEPSIAKLGRRHLESLGYRAESTTDPLNALALVKMDPDKFDLVISDMAMPKMTGDQLVGEILKICPDMPTIICTGYSAQISEKEAGKMGISSFLMKPVRRADLAQTIRQALDNNKGSTC